MALTTKFPSSFWSRDDIGALDPAAKLAIAWVKTTKDMTNIGYLQVHKRQFTFETGLPIQVLEGALKGLQGAFLFEEKNGVFGVLELERIAEQFSDRALAGKNHIVTHLLGLIGGLSEPMREAIFERYEDLRSRYQAPSTEPRGIQAPSRGQSRAEYKQSRAEHSEGMQGESSVNAQIQFPIKNFREKSEPDGPSDEAESGAAPFHVEQKTPVKSGLRYDLAEEVLRFLNERAGTTFLGTPAMFQEIALRLHQVGNDAEEIKKMVARQVAMWAGDGKMREYLRPATLFQEEKFANYFGQRELPLPDGDAAARAVQLQRLIEESRANKGSSFWSSQATAQEVEQLKNWRAELRALREGGRKERAA